VQLLRITTKPLKYELEIEHPRLEYKQDLIPSADVDTKPARLKIDRIENAEVKINTYEARKSLGLMNIADSVKKNFEDGEKHIHELTREYVEIGKEISNIQDGAKISDIFRAKILEQPELYTAYLPSVGADISWSPAQLEFSYEKGNTDYNWHIKENELSFIPGSIRVKISELASVEIEYIGGPLYFPPSAAPDYEETEEA